MLSDAFPGPTWLTLGGELYRVGQLTMGDLAYLERWAAARIGEPWPILRKVEIEEDQKRRKELLRDAYRAALGVGKGFGSPEIDRELATVEGRIVALWRAMRRYQHDLSQADAVAVAYRMAADEWLEAERIAWDLDGLDAAARAIDREIGVDFSPQMGQGESWDKIVSTLVWEAGLSLTEIRRLTIGQCRLLCRGGEPKTRPFAEPSPTRGWNLKRIDAELLRPRMNFLRNGHAVTASASSPDSGQTPLRPDPPEAPSGS